MRDALAPYIGQRIQITAPVQRLGARTAWTGVKEPTVLLGPILDTQGNELADHLWFVLGQRLAAVAPQPGDVLTLTGRVRPYTRRRRQYHGTTLTYESDLGLSYPARCAVVARAPELTATPTPEPEPAKAEPTPPTESVDRSHRISVPSSDIPARARILFAAAVLALEFPEGVSLTRLNARAGVPPVAFLAQLKKLGNAGIVTFTPTGRVVLTTQPTTSAIGGAQ